MRRAWAGIRREGGSETMEGKLKRRGLIISFYLQVYSTSTSNRLSDCFLSPLHPNARRIFLAHVSCPHSRAKEAKTENCLNPLTPSSSLESVCSFPSLTLTAFLFKYWQFLFLPFLFRVPSLFFPLLLSCPLPPLREPILSLHYVHESFAALFLLSPRQLPYF